MDITSSESELSSEIWEGGNKPLNASYGKLMMWFFLVSDALTFSGFIVSYGFRDLKILILGLLPMRFLLISLFCMELMHPCIMLL